MGVLNLPPDHMDVWSRNERLYEALKGMGLYVIPIPLESDPSRIDHLRVAAALPASVSSHESGGQPPSEPRVSPVVEGAQVGRVIATAEGERNNVVDLPTVRR